MSTKSITATLAGLVVNETTHPASVNERIRHGVRFEHKRKHKIESSPSQTTIAVLTHARHGIIGVDTATAARIDSYVLAVRESVLGTEVEVTTRSIALHKGYWIPDAEFISPLCSVPTYRPTATVKLGTVPKLSPERLAYILNAAKHCECKFLLIVDKGNILRTFKLTRSEFERAKLRGSIDGEWLLKSGKLV